MSQSKLDKDKKPSAQLKAAVGEEKGKQMSPPQFSLESSTAQAKMGKDLENEAAYAPSGGSFSAASKADPKQMKADVEAYEPKKMSMTGESSAPVQAKMGGGVVQRMGRASKEQELPSPESLPGNEDMVREIFQFFYPDMGVPPMGSSAEQLAAEMMAAAIRGSKAMDFIPRPPAVPSPTWLFTEAVKMAWRRGGQQGIYAAVRNVVANNFRPQYDMVMNGI